MAIQGARQTGKSFLARQLLGKEVKDSKYLTFDHLSVREDAKRAPHTFLTENEPDGLLIIDEAQKVPEIFDAVKFEADQERRPGRFLLLGSTEFSRLTQVREALTGRIGRIRLFPLVLAEAQGDLQETFNPSRKQVLQYLKSGGMPGIFAVRDEEEWEALMQDWLDLTCMRDLQQFKTLSLDGELAFSILKLASTLEEPTQAAMARVLKQDSRKIATHLKALCELFVLVKLSPHPSGTGKPIYLPLDVGIARFLGAPLSRRLQVWLMVERMALNAYSREKRKSFYYYRSTGKKMIHLIEESIEGPLQAFQVTESERILKIDAQLMRAFLAKNPGAKGRVFSPVLESQKVLSVSFDPWEEIATRWSLG